VLISKIILKNKKYIILIYFKMFLIDHLLELIQVLFFILFFKIKVIILSFYIIFLKKSNQISPEIFTKSSKFVYDMQFNSNKL